MKIPSLRWIVLWPLVLAGCFEVNQEITINADGSGQLKAHYAIDKDKLDMMKGVQAGGGVEMQGADFPMTEEDVRKGFDGREGVKLKDVQVEDKEGRRHVRFTVEYRDASELLGDPKIGKFRLHKDGAGNYVLASVVEKKEKKPQSPEEEMMEKQMRAMLVQMMKGLKFSVKVNTPTQIVATNAHNQADKSATWSYDIEKDASFLDDEPEVRLVFKSGGLKLREFGETAPGATDGGQEE
jgi:hypothetical protein